MPEWFDNLAKTLARATVFGGFRAPTWGGGGGFALARAPGSLTLQAGPCGVRLNADELDTHFSTQISTPDRQLLNYDATTMRDRRRGTVRATVTARRGNQALFQLETTTAPRVSPTVTVLLGSGFQGIRQVGFAARDGSLEGTIDGRPIHPLPLPHDASVMPGSADLRFADGAPPPTPAIDPAMVVELRDIAYKAQRELPTCVHSLGGLAPLDATSFPGCDDCHSLCDKAEQQCVAECAVSAGSCGPFYGVCLAACGSVCLSRKADCENQCDNPPGACCPQRCEQGGYASCCSPADKCCGPTCCSGDRACCGSTCCPPEQHCADPQAGVCCPSGSGPACGNGCCPPGQKCGNSYWHFCCPADAGEFCLDEFNRPFCCPSGQVCLDASTGLCCPKDAGPRCGDTCCARGEVCRDGVCCDPRLLCGDGERAVCCFGVCRDGQCCSTPSHMCGQVCCPPFNVCCDVGGKQVCCGSYEVCLHSGCCPQERVCGRQCCPPGHMCKDPLKEVCVPCPPDLVPCLLGPSGNSPAHSICCLPNVTCCAGKCCAPYEICCQPGGLPVGCYPSNACIH
jgi:hypothetical protein